MDFSYSEEQQMLRDSIGKFISQDYDFDSRRAIVDSDTGYSMEHWKTFAELGWLTVPFKETDGGFGGSAVDLMVVMEEFGKGLLVEPFLANTVLAGTGLSEAANEQQKQTLLQPLMEGNLQLAFAFAEPQSRYQLADVQCSGQIEDNQIVINGHKAVVLNGEAADKLLVSVRTSGQTTERHGISLIVVDADSAGISHRAYTNVDGHRAADIWFDQVTVPVSNLLGEADKAIEIIEMVIDRAALAVCAEAVGAMQISLERTVEYTKIRKQFGVTLASFQALQHRMARMFMEVEQARSILLMAAMEMDRLDGRAPRALSAAKSRIGKAARKVGQESIQIHGGVGVTDELDVGHYFKRLTTIQYQFGSTDFHTARFAGS
ncbi:MAG: pimeloyl-CoA dehydrogenase small subunit [Halieaceae bacterium]|jgi:alkylation response protein AidB-like acyl-CoA dehydrogenase|nr:pimeloyl-CoA dehydrogenase small subunit [Halieaceae bacterium]